MKKRILTAIGLVTVFTPIYFYANTNVVLLLAAVLCYGLSVESFAMTYGSRYAWIWGGFSLGLLAGLISFFGLNHLMIYLLPVVAFLWVIRIINMGYFKHPFFSKDILFGCQILDIWIFIVSFSVLYLKDKYFLFYMLLMVIGIDSFSYFIGKFLGTRHIVRSISPNKTLEGYLGGLAWVYAYGSIILIPKDMSILALTLFLGMVYILAITGDLLVSSQKRLLDVKDSGMLLPGHGGLLDRFDSWIFVSALVCYVVMIN